MGFCEHRDRICDRIERGRSPQEVMGRYRAALRRDEFTTDEDYSMLDAARDRGLERLAKERKALSPEHAIVVKHAILEGIMNATRLGENSNTLAERVIEQIESYGFRITKGK